MAFDLLPESVILQIFRYLPFNQRVRIGDVCSRFHRVSVSAISETKSLDLNNPIFQRIRPANLSVLLELCSNRLERIRFPKSFDRSLIEAFSQFSFPRLAEIRIDHTRIGNELFGTLLRKNQNLQIITWNFNSTSPVFPDDVVCEKLETLNVSCFDDSSFRSFIGRCPNLKRFETEIQSVVSRETLDEFFASYPATETLIFRELNGDFAFVQLSHFWCLEFLRTLIICGDPMHRFTDADLTKISASFPQLEELGLVWLSITKEAVSALASLSHLRKLAFENTYNTGDGEIDEGLQRIAECGGLQELQFYYSISRTTLNALIQFCTELRFLCIWKVRDAATPETAAAVVQSMAGMPSGMDVTVRICHEVSADMWQSEVVSAALEQLQAEGGRVIRFEDGEAIRFWDLA